MSFDWKEAEKLKEQGAKDLRKAGHKAPNLKKRRRKKQAVEYQEIKEVTSRESYWIWLESHGYVNEEGCIIEPEQANPDSIIGEEGIPGTY
jgi:hypothetical protein